MLSLDALYAAQDVLQNVIRKTPVISAYSLAKNLHIKTENLQKTGSFKLRGAYYKMSTLTEGQRQQGVIACSAGNHAQGVAFAAAQMHIPATICIPYGAPLSKIEATRRYGAKVVLVPGVYDDAYGKAKELQKAHDHCFIHPFDDPAIITGQGTVGLELLEQLPEVDTVVVPIGGGGLIAGIAFAIKSLRPQCKVIGVEAQGAASMTAALGTQAPVTLEQVSTIADGIAVKRVGDLPFSLCSRYVDDILTVTDDEIAAAILALMEREKTVSEGAGATAVAAVMAGKLPAGRASIAAIVSGGNIDVNMLSRIIDQGLDKSGRLMRFTTEVQDKPGQLIPLLRILYDSQANVLSVSHHRKIVKIGSCLVELELETKNHDHIASIFNALRDNGYPIYTQAPSLPPLSYPAHGKQ